MDELLLIAVVVSVVLNILLFFFLYNKKRDSDLNEGFEESAILEKVLKQRYTRLNGMMNTVFTGKGNLVKVPRFFVGRIALFCSKE